LTLKTADERALLKGGNSPRSPLPRFHGKQLLVIFRSQQTPEKPAKLAAEYWKLTSTYFAPGTSSSVDLFFAHTGKLSMKASAARPQKPLSCVERRSARSLAAPEICQSECYYQLA